MITGATSLCKDQQIVCGLLDTLLHGDWCILCRLSHTKAIQMNSYLSYLHACSSCASQGRFLCKFLHYYIQYIHIHYTYTYTYTYTERSLLKTCLKCLTNPKKNIDIFLHSHTQKPVSPNIYNFLQIYLFGLLCLYPQCPFSV